MNSKIDLKIIVTNPPSEEEAKEKIKKLQEKLKIILSN